MPTVKDGVSHRLQAERKRVGLTQEQLRKVTGISKVTLSSYETGTTSPTVKFLTDISKQGLDVQHILFGSLELRDDAKRGYDFKLVHECYDHVSFFMAATCPECPGLHRWNMIQKLYGIFSANPELSIQDIQSKLRDIYSDMTGHEI